MIVDHFTHDKIQRRAEPLQALQHNERFVPSAVL
jgi:hypothetical protein